VKNLDFHRESAKLTAGYQRPLRMADGLDGRQLKRPDFLHFNKRTGGCINIIVNIAARRALHEKDLVK
jgi:hypothetical protein